MLPNKYTIVHLNGEVFFNLDKICSLVASKKLFFHSENNSRIMFTNPKNSQKSFFYHCIESLFKYGVSTDDIWWKNIYNENGWFGTVDTLYFEEFSCFLIEDCIKFESCTILTEDDIFKNFESIDFRGLELTQEELKWMFLEGATEEVVTPHGSLFEHLKLVHYKTLIVDTVEELDINYKKLVLKYHPTLDDTKIDKYKYLYLVYKARKKYICDFKQ